MKLLVLLISFSLVYAVGSEYDSAGYSEYYLCLAATSFCIFGISVGAFAHKGDRLLLGYSLIQFTMICLYVPAIHPVNFTTFDNIMYNGVLSFSALILMYEALLLIFGLKDGYNAITRLFNDRHFSRNTHQRSN